MMKKFTLLFFALFATTLISKAQVMTESFEYATGSTLDSNGWNQHSGSSSPISVDAASLTLNQYSPTSIGGSAVSSGTSQDVNAYFGPISSGDVYASFLLKVDTINSSGYFFHLMEDVLPSFAFRARTFFRQDASNPNAFNLGMTFNSSTGVFDTTEFTFGSTILVVAKYSIISGSSNDAVSLYAFDASGSFTTEPATALIGPVTGTSNDIDPARIALRQFSNNGGYTVDAFSIDTTWNMSPAFSKAQIDLPITWDDAANVDYTVTDFGGDSSAVVVDPTNASNMVLNSVKSGTAQLWAGTTLSTPMGLATAIPFVSGSTTMSVAVWSPDAGTVVRLKAEDASDPTKSVETEATTGAAATWDTLVFDFNNPASGTAAINFSYTYDKLSIFFGFGTAGAGSAKSYYCDDVMFIAGTPPTLAQIDLPITWDDAANVDYTVTDFGGDSSAVVVDPTNANNMVLNSVKSGTAQLWAGTTLSTPMGLATAIPFVSGSTTMSVAVWSPDAGTVVRLKAEDASDPTKSVETEATTGAAATWDTLVFDFNNPASGTAAINFSYTYDKLSIFFGFGTAGAGSAKSYYCDDVMFIAGTPPTLAQIDLPITWDDTANVDYTVTDFGGDSSLVVVDPTNASNMVLQTIKSGTAQLWAGTTLSTPMGLATAIPFVSGSTTMSVAVWSPDAGTVVRLKAEDASDPTKSVETEATTGAAATWDTLVFDFNNQAAGTAPINFAFTYDKLSIFYGFGTAGAGTAKTYYTDDVFFGSGITPPTLAQIDLPITWDDTANVDYTVTDFGGDSSLVVVDPTNASNMVLSTTKSNTAQTWAGTTLSTPNGLAMAIPFVSGSTTVSVAIWSPDANIPVRLKAEDHTDPTKSVETETMTTVASAWDTLVFDFANEAMGTAPINFAYNYDMLSIFYNFGTDGATAGTKTYYCDDVFFGSGITPPTKAQIDLPITWDDGANIDYTVTDFGGDSSLVVVDPTNAGNMVLSTTKSNTAQSWAGTTLSTPNGLATAIPFAAGNTLVSVAIWSPDANIPVRLKAEDHTDPTKSVETEMMTTVAGGWDTLVFDFANEATGTAPIDFTNTYDLLSIFYNFGTDGATAGAKTYYCDDVFFGNATIGIEENWVQDFKVFPNPNTGSFNISGSLKVTSEVSILITDMHGRIILEESEIGNSLNKSIDLTGVSNGIYLVKITSELGSVTERVVISK